MILSNFKLYLILFPLLLVLDGCYTLLYDPLRIKPAPKINVRDLEKNNERDERNEYTPMVNRRYEWQLQYPYTPYRNGYYPNISYYSNGYNSYSTYHVHNESQPSVSQAQKTITPTQQSAKVEVKDETASRDVERAKRIWQKRINPRIRKAPTLTRRQKDEE
jgi:hypothetical protein